MADYLTEALNMATGGQWADAALVTESDKSKAKKLLKVYAKDKSDEGRGARAYLRAVASGRDADYLLDQKGAEGDGARAAKKALKEGLIEAKKPKRDEIKSARAEVERLRQQVDRAKAEIKSRRARDKERGLGGSSHHYYMALRDAEYNLQSAERRLKALLKEGLIEANPPGTGWGGEAWFDPKAKKKKKKDDDADDAGQPVEIKRAAGGMLYTGPHGVVVRTKMRSTDDGPMDEVYLGKKPAFGIINAHWDAAFAAYMLALQTPEKAEEMRKAFRKEWAHHVVYKRVLGLRMESPEAKKLAKRFRKLLQRKGDKVEDDTVVDPADELFEMEAGEMDAWWQETRGKLIRGSKSTRKGRLNGCYRQLTTRMARTGGIKVSGQSHTDKNPVPKRERDVEDQPDDGTPGELPAGVSEADVVRFGAPFRDPLRTLSLDEDEKMSQSELARVFKSLKPKEKILVAMTSVMGMGKYTDGKYHEWIVGRKSSSKKYGRVSYTLLPADGSWKPTKFNRFALNMRKDMVTASQGDMALMLKGIKRPGAAEDIEALDEAAPAGKVQKAIMGVLTRAREVGQKPARVDFDALHALDPALKLVHYDQIVRGSRALAKKGLVKIIPGKVGEDDVIELVEHAISGDIEGSLDEEAKINWKRHAQALLKQAGDEPLGYKAYLRAIIQGNKEQATHLRSAKSYMADAARAMQALIDSAGKGEPMGEAYSKSGKWIGWSAADDEAFYKAWAPPEKPKLGKKQKPKLGFKVKNAWGAKIDKLPAELMRVINALQMGGSASASKAGKKWKRSYNEVKPQLSAFLRKFPPGTQRGSLAVVQEKDRIVIQTPVGVIHVKDKRTVNIFPKPSLLAEGGSIKRSEGAIVLWGAISDLHVGSPEGIGLKDIEAAIKGRLRKRGHRQVSASIVRRLAKLIYNDAPGLGIEEAVRQLDSILTKNEAYEGSKRSKPKGKLLAPADDEEGEFDTASGGTSSGPAKKVKVESLGNAVARFRDLTGE